MAWRRVVACVLAMLTVACSPGLTPYAVLAQTVGQTPGGVSSSGSGSAAGSTTGAGSTQRTVPQVSVQVLLSSTLGGLASAPMPTASVQGPAAAKASGVGAADAAPISAPSAGATSSVAADRPAVGIVSVPRTVAADGVAVSKTTAEKTAASKTAAAAVHVPETKSRALLRAAAAVKSVGRVLSDKIAGRPLTERLEQVFENGRTRAAQDVAADARVAAAAPAGAAQGVAVEHSGLQPAAEPTEILEHAAPPAPPKSAAPRVGRGAVGAATRGRGVVPAGAAAPRVGAAARSFARDFYDVFLAPLAGGAATLLYPFRHPVVAARAVGAAVRHPIETARRFAASATGGAASSLSEFNSSEKAYLAGQAVFLFAISVYLASLPLLVTALTGDPAMTGVARAVHYWSFGVASLFSGRIVRSTPMRRILGGGAAARAAAFGLIGLLAFAGMLPWSAFLILVGANALIVALNHLVDIDTNGARKIFSSDEKIERAGYLYDFIYYGMMLVVPPVIGLAMDAIDAHFGAGLGAFSGFALFAGIMGAVSWIYTTKVKVIGETVHRWALEVTQGAPRRWGLGLLAASAAVGGGAWLALGSAILAAPVGLAALGVAAAAAISGVIALLHYDTLATIFRNKAVLARWTMATAENFVEDALFAVVLPTFALEVLGTAAFGNGLMLSGITLGGLVASKLLVSKAKDHQKRMGTYRFLSILTLGASLAFIPSMGLWLHPTLLLAVPLVFLMKYLYQPIRSRMRALLQVSIKNDPEADKRSEDIYGLMTVVEVIAAGAGGLAFAWLFHGAGPGSALFNILGSDAAMKAVTAVLAGMSLVYLAGLSWVKGQLTQPARKVYAADPDPAKAAQVEAAAYEKLKKNLETLGLKPYVTRVEEAPVSEDRPTVAILCPASTHKLSMALEGGRQSPGDVHLALDPSWLIQETAADGRTTLRLKKGVYFDQDGQAVLVEYTTPRKVRYFGNFYTLGANDRADGVPLEENLDAPQSSSLRLEAVTNDKLGTRLMMAARKVGVPATLALLMPLHPLARQQAAMAAGVQVATIEDGASRRETIRARVAEYLDHFEGSEIVVKPSGPQYHSGRGVKFFPRDSREAIIAHATLLSEDPMMTADGAVLIDERVPSLPIERGRKLGPAQLNAPDTASEENGRRLETTLRVLVARTPWGGFETSGVFARVGPWGKPTTAEAADPRDNATVESWRGLLKDWVLAGALTEEQARRLDEKVQSIGPASFDAIDRNERNIARKPGDPRQDQSDLIGLDVMIARRPDGTVEPVVIEVNDHDSGGQYHVEFVLKEGREHSSPLVATWLARARRDALKGKRIVLVGAGYPGNAGYPGKKMFFERAQELGVKVVLIDKPGSWAKDMVDEHIALDTENEEPAAALAKAKKKLLRSARKNGKLDGITTFWEDDVLFTSKLAAELGLRYHSAEAAEAARNKYELRAAMAEAGLPSPRYAILRTRKELETLLADKAKSVHFPAVLKPIRGAAAQGVFRVNSAQEAASAFDKVAADVDPAKDSIFKQGREILHDEYLDGREGDADIVWQGGKAVYSSITDNWPTREPYFLATGSSLPSRTLTAKEQREVLDLASKALAALRFSDGVFHVEFKYTSKGPRLIEINARPGGVYVVPWNETVNGVDLAEMLLLTAAGVPAVPYKPSKPRIHLEGEFLIPGRSGLLERLQMDGSPEEAFQGGFHELLTMKVVGSQVAPPPAGYDRVGMLTAKGKSAAEAQANLDKQRTRLRLEIK